MKCSCCDQQRMEIHTKKSELWQDLTLYLCNTCRNEKKEPRWVVVLAGKAFGFDHVKEYIKHHRYCGADIPASDLV